MDKNLYEVDKYHKDAAIALIDTCITHKVPASDMTLIFGYAYTVLLSTAPQEAKEAIQNEMNACIEKFKIINSLFDDICKKATDTDKEPTPTPTSFV